MTLQFEPISLEKQQDYLKILARCPQVASDYSFMNIWAWAEDYGLTWAWSDDCVWIRQSRPEVLYWAPVGPWSEIDWPTRLSEASGDPTIFIRIPNQLVEIWQTAFTDRAAFEEERGHWDYVYSVSELVDLKGPSKAIEEIVLQIRPVKLGSYPLQDDKAECGLIGCLANRLGILLEPAVDVALPMVGRIS